MTTARLALPTITQGQASPDVTHNEALRCLDAFVFPVIQDRDLTVPPASPANGHCWIVGPAATGAWATHDGKIAQWYASAWHFYTAQNGWAVVVLDEAKLVTRLSNAWSAGINL